MARISFYIRHLRLGISYDCFRLSAHLYGFWLCVRLWFKQWAQKRFTAWANLESSCLWLRFWLRIWFWRFLNSNRLALRGCLMRYFNRFRLNFLFDLVLFIWGIKSLKLVYLVFLCFSWAIRTWAVYESGIIIIYTTIFLALPFM